MYQELYLFGPSTDKSLVSKTTLEITHAIGPFDEIELTGMSPFELNGLPSERRGSSGSIGSTSSVSKDEEERKRSFKQRVRRISSRTWKSFLRILDLRYWTEMKSARLGRGVLMTIFSQSWRGEEPSSLAIPTRERMMRQSTHSTRPYHESNLPHRHEESY